MNPAGSLTPTILFVDDEPRILKAIGRVVRREPYHALFAEGGGQALEKMRQTPVQVIVSDLNMPEMDGLTLLQSVRRDFPETIRIVLSAVTELDPILEAIHAGNIYRYITKPYEPRELVLILRQALDAWRVQEEKRDLQEWIQLNKVIEDELHFFDADNLFKYEVEKRIHLNGELPLVWANPLHMQQIIDNLVHNALDAMADSRIRQLTISTYCQENSVCLSIADTGTGIDAQNLPLIFQPDFTTKPLDKGTGLGLASVKTMTESYGGRIEVRSNDPQGAIFIVCLPVSR